MIERAALATATILALMQSAVFAQIRWINDLEQGLREARDRDAPIVALLWDYN